MKFIRRQEFEKYFIISHDILVAGVTEEDMWQEGVKGVGSGRFIPPWPLSLSLPPPPRYLRLNYSSKIHSSTYIYIYIYSLYPEVRLYATD